MVLNSSEESGLPGLETSVAPAGVTEAMSTLRRKEFCDACVAKWAGPDQYTARSFTGL
jgi:hypothetical protein